MILTETEKAIAVLTYCKENNLGLFIKETADDLLLVVDFETRNGNGFSNDILHLGVNPNVLDVLNVFYDEYMRA